MNNPIFPNDEAILKYSVDKNGLYMNNAFGENDYLSPYLGVAVRKDMNGNLKYFPEFNIPSNIFEDVRNDIKVREAISKGFNYFENKDKGNNFPIILQGYDSPLKAAYVAQFFKFSDDVKDKIISLIVHIYLQKDEEVDKWLNDIPDFMYEPVSIEDYKQNKDKYQIDQKMVEDAKLRKIQVKNEISKKRQLDKNKKEFLIRMEKYAKKIHYKYDVMTEELALKLMKKKFN